MTDQADKRTFTVYLAPADIGDDHIVVAHNLSGLEAIKTALELGGAWGVHDWEDEYETFRLYRWRPHAKQWPKDGREPDSLYATVVKTTDRVRDRAVGMSMIVDQFLRQSRKYSKAHVETDHEFDKRLLHVAKRREVHRLDRVIATKLIDALLAEGYVVTDASYEEFERSADREAILEILLDVDRIELFVERNDEESWMRLIFGENGWDLVQDYTVDLGYLIDPIVEPLLPWKRDRAGRREGSDALASSPEIPPETERVPK
ncbi:hypothetical protein IQ16_00698 [Bradyrhizobium huanghuaihaiense]|uniref:Uncharacterized protein n=1 Tax=Bradyrhizobium huanghuaihaiense TaxID=990078 RepID=A0A562S5A8_9BRAD|nr:hypothetical protein [Bradyrhizobium huanghuaihaiense]TWI76457.1 hypothetical protein IQ16_00698 [Bradyrhizobium huanghuaihaiense]